MNLYGLTYFSNGETVAIYPTRQLAENAKKKQEEPQYWYVTEIPLIVRNYDIVGELKKSCFRQWKVAERKSLHSKESFDNFYNLYRECEKF